MSSQYIPAARAEHCTARRDIRTQALVGPVSNATTVPPTIGLAEFITQTIKVTPRDVLVVKMDIEGAEYETIDALIAARAHELVDEIFIEVHYKHRRMDQLYKWCVPNRNQRVAPHWCSLYKLEDASRLLNRLRSLGVYAHAWP